MSISTACPPKVCIYLQAELEELYARQPTLQRRVPRRRVALAIETCVRELLEHIGAPPPPREEPPPPAPRAPPAAAGGLSPELLQSIRAAPAGGGARRNRRQSRLTHPPQAEAAGAAYRKRLPSGLQVP